MRKYEWQLFDIDSRLAALIEESTDPETGECNLDYDALMALEMERDALLEGLAHTYKNSMAFAASCAEEIKSIESKQAVAEQNAAEAKECLFRALNGEPMKTPTVSITWRRSKSTKIDDAVFFANEANRAYWKEKVTTTADNAAVKAAIEAGEKIAGAEIVENLNMTVK